MTAPRSGQLLVGCLVGYAGLIVAPLGCGGLISGDPVGMGFGLVMGGASALLLYSAVDSIRTGWDALQREQAETRRLREEDRPVGEGPVLEAELVAAWDVSPEDWRRFNAADLRERLAVALGMVLGFATLGAVGLALARAVPLTFAVPFSGAFGVLVAALWLLWITRARWQRPPRVRIGRDAVLVGNVRHTLRSDMHRLDRVTVEDGDPPVMVFTVSWSTRNGPSGDDVRVPVPPDRLQDARRVAAELCP